MAEKIHPTQSPPNPVEAPSSQPEMQQAVPPPQPGTYVVQVPKDQIYRYPPPGNARRYEDLSTGKTRRSCCGRCFCYTLCILLFLVVSLAVAAGVLYLIFRPEAPDYAVTSFAIKGLNLTSSGVISPEFDVSVRADNKNDKLGIYYRSGSEVNVYYDGVDLVSGALPVFYQPSNNVTVFAVAMKGSNVELGNGVKSSLTAEQRQGKVPFLLKIKAPVKIKIGSVKTWEITVKVNCDVTVDALTDKSKIVSKDCDYSVRLW